MVYTLEKQIIIEFINMYKDQPCLWNTSHPLYSNKLARNRALDIILEKYKELDSMADHTKMKKKIENMRTTYKREYTKVVKSRLSGGEVYEPSLWYYNDMKFLDVLSEDANQTEQHISDSQTDVITYHDATNDTDYDDDEGSVSSIPRAKRQNSTSVYLAESDNEYVETVKSTSSKKAKTSIVYLDEDDNIYQEEPPCSVKNEPSDLYRTLSESDLFGKTISTQLNELRPKQRFIAEKLISDVIFYGRLDKLKTGTTLELNDDL